MHRSNATLLCFKRLKFLIFIHFFLSSLSFAEFLREASLRDARGNYCPISDLFCLINGGLIACYVGTCILSAACFIARHISTLMLSYFYEDFAVAKDYFCIVLFTFDTNKEEVV
jgi:hypothetical protein